MGYQRASSRWTPLGVYLYLGLLLSLQPPRFSFLSRMAIAFYCLGTLDLTGLTEQKISPTDRQSWKEWIWDQYVGE